MPGLMMKKTFNEHAEEYAKMLIEDGFVFINSDGLIDSTNTQHGNTSKK